MVVEANEKILGKNNVESIPLEKYGINKIIG